MPRALLTSAQTSDLSRALCRLGPIPRVEFCRDGGPLLPSLLYHCLVSLLFCRAHCSPICSLRSCRKDFVAKGKPGPVPSATPMHSSLGLATPLHPYGSGDADMQTRALRVKELGLRGPRVKVLDACGPCYRDFAFRLGFGIKAKDSGFMVWDLGFGARRSGLVVVCMHQAGVCSAIKPGIA